MSPSAADKYADRWLHKVKRRLAKPVRATTTQESIHPIRGPENNRTAAVLRRVDTMHNARYATGNIIKTRLSNIHDNWLHDQVDYVEGLSARDKASVKMVTLRSQEWLTPYMRGEAWSVPTSIRIMRNGFSRGPWEKQIYSKPRPKKPDEYNFPQLQNATQKYAGRPNFQSITNAAARRTVFQKATDALIKDLKRIIAKAPVVRKRIVVYRGIGGYKMPPGTAITANKAFMATSFDADYALRASDQWSANNRDPLKITIPPGARVLLVGVVNTWNGVNGHGEYEIVLPPETRFKVTKRSTKWVATQTGTHKKALVTELTMLV
jgi:hypothetical protein